MRLSRFLCFSLTLSIGTLPSSAVLAQDTTRVTILGTVIDSRSGLPIERVEVTLSDLGVVTLTDPAGAFFLADIPLGTYQLNLRKEGYETAEGPLEVFSQGSVVIRLAPTAAANRESSRIVGTVTDLDSRDPLEGALVSIEGVQLNRITDSDGRFELTDIPPGNRQLSVELIGYSTRTESITVPAASILTLDVGLTVEPIELDPVFVSVERRSFELELAGFYERRESTSGLFVTRERIEERAPLNTTDLFRGLAGIRVVGGLGMGTQQAVVLAGSRALSFSGGGGACYPTVWIDGQMVHEGTAGPMGGGPAFLDNLIQPDQIAGLEIYNSSASMPVQYNLYGGCGVIVIWTM